MQQINQFNIAGKIIKNRAQNFEDSGKFQNKKTNPDRASRV